jgi:glycosyltransferase involved in cell wall biosynthesis
MARMNTEKKILFLPLYDEDWASSKYRVYKHIHHLERLGLRCEVLRPPLPKLFSRLSYYANLFFSIPSFNVIFIQKKIFRLPLLRMILMLKKKIIFDFDDAIYCFEKDLKAIQYILSEVDHVLAADDPLANYASRYNKHVTVLPTPLESGHYTGQIKTKTENTIKISWIGRPWNHHYLSDLEHVFERLCHENSNIALYVVSGSPFHFSNSAIPVFNIPWSEKAEEEILHSVDIGIVPLRDDEWSRGKCAYKVLLYMSHGIPVIASPVGVKTLLVRNGDNGILASSLTEWVDAIRFLAENDEERRKLGFAGYETFMSGYTYDTLSLQLAHILEKI